MLKDSGLNLEEYDAFGHVIRGYLGETKPVAKKINEGHVIVFRLWP